MIPRSTLEAILPGMDAPDLQLDPRESEAVREDDLLRRVAKWREAIRRAFATTFLLEPRYDALAVRSLITPATIIGIGVIDVPEGWSDRRLQGIPTHDGYALGLAIYGPPVRRTPHEEDFLLGLLPLHDSPNIAVPIVLHQADWRLHHHPIGGRTAAVVSDGMVDYLLTARHVVEQKRIGAKIGLNCGSCAAGCFGTVAMKGHLYLDVALIRIEQPMCLAQTNQPVSFLPAVLGATVRHHFGSSGRAVPATVTQAVGPPGAFVNAAAPLTFLTDEVGIKGDSGSAITSDRPSRQYGTRDLVGTYSGRLKIRMPGPTVRHRDLGFGHDAFEAMQLFQTTIKEGIYL